MFDQEVLVLDERGPGILLAGSGMVTSISNYIHRSKDPDALARQVRRWMRSMNQTRSDCTDATPPAGQPKLGEFLKKAREDRSAAAFAGLDPALRPRAAMPQLLLSSSGTSATSAVPARSDKTASPKDITSQPRLAKSWRLLQPEQRRPPPDPSAEDSMICQTEERLSQKEAAKSGQGAA